MDLVLGQKYEVSQREPVNPLAWVMSGFKLTDDQRAVFSRYGALGGTYELGTWDTGRERWTKRFARAYADTFARKPEEKALSDLGERVAAMAKPALRTVTLSNSMDWEEGAFGDFGSCWFRPAHRSYEFRRRFFDSGRGFAVRLHRNGDEFQPNSGPARAFVSTQGDKLYVWNGRGSLTTAQLARTLAALLGLEAQPVAEFRLPQNYVDGTAYAVGRTGTFPGTPVTLTF